MGTTLEPYRRILIFFRHNFEIVFFLKDAIKNQIEVGCGGCGSSAFVFSFFKEPSAGGTEGGERQQQRETEAKLFETPIEESLQESQQESQESVEMWPQPFQAGVQEDVRQVAFTKGPLRKGSLREILFPHQQRWTQALRQSAQGQSAQSQSRLRQIALQECFQGQEEMLIR